MFRYIFGKENEHNCGVNSSLNNYIINKTESE